MASSPLIVTYKAWQGRASVANTNRDGTGTIVDVVIAHPANGSRVDLVRGKAEGTTTAGQMRIFLHNGTAWRLLQEAAMTAITPSGSVQAWDSGDLYFRAGGLHLPAGWKLGVAVHNAEPVNLFAIGGDYGAAT